jgi:hypothetical protein
VVTIFIWICWNVRWYSKNSPRGGWKLFERPLDIYMLFLFVFDCIQAVGGMLNIWWAHIGIVRTGPYCTVQGITQQTGELGVALMTLVRRFLPCLRDRGTLTHALPDSRYPHICVSTVASRTASMWVCILHGRAHLGFHRTLGWYWGRHSQEL